MDKIGSAAKRKELYSEAFIQQLHQRMETDPCGAYLEEVTARCLCEQPGWNPENPLCVWTVLETAVTCFPAEQMIKRSLDAEDWQGLNRVGFQSVRLRTLGLRLNPGEEFWYFFQALTAIAVGDDGLMEWIFPAGMEKKVPKKVYPLYRVGAPLLAGLWYQDQALLEFAVPAGEKFAASKKSQWEKLENSSKPCVRRSLGWMFTGKRSPSSPPTGCTSLRPMSSVRRSLAGWPCRTIKPFPKAMPGGTMSTGGRWPWHSSTRSSQLTTL